MCNVIQIYLDNININLSSNTISMKIVESLRFYFVTILLTRIKKFKQQYSFM